MDSFATTAFHFDAPLCQATDHVAAGATDVGGNIDRMLNASHARFTDFHGSPVTTKPIRNLCYAWAPESRSSGPAVMSGLANGVAEKTKSPRPLNSDGGL